MGRFAMTMCVAATAMLVGASVAGCGSSGPDAAPSASRTRHAATQTPGLNYARCMRSHRVARFPDPSASGGFNLSTSHIEPSSPAVRSAEAACRSLLPVKRPPNVHPTAAAYGRLLHWVRCMRTHGVPGMADPKPNPPPGPNAAGVSPYNTVMGDGGYWVGIPKYVDGHSSAFVQLAGRCGESPLGHGR